VAVGADDGGGDDLGSRDLPAVVDAANDLSADAACARADAENCHNGCDDDNNGFADDDDPACTPQILTTPAPSPSGNPGALARLLLLPVPVFRPLDANPLLPGAFPEYQRAFANSIFFGIEGGARILRTVALGAVGSAGALHDESLAYGVRDACIFNGELLVVGGHTLHRFKADGMTELGKVDRAQDVLLTSCTSDGTHLYIAEHDMLAGPSKFEVFDKTLALVGTIDLPAALTAAGYDRCLDFTWLPERGFLGLFVISYGELNDGKLNADQIIPFNFDGGVGDPIDAGALHSIGTFRF
jgi:hypothetical protein